MTTSQSGQIWQIVHLEPNIRLFDETDTLFRPLLVCILNTTTEEVLAFRIARDNTELETATNLALYDALITERRPSRDAAHGIIWYLPRAVVPETDWSENTQTILESLGIYALTPKRIVNEATRTLYGNWDRDLYGYTLWKDHFVQVFDNFLERFLGYSPLRVTKTTNSAILWGDCLESRTLMKNQTSCWWWRLSINRYQKCGDILQ